MLSVFGDSWVHGDELPEESREQQRWSALISKHFNLSEDNHGVSGNSIQGTLWDFQARLDSTKRYETKMVMVGITAGNRMSWFQSSKSHIQSVSLENNNGKPRDSIKLMHKIFRSEIHHWHLDRYTYFLAVHFIGSICRQLNIPCVQFNIYHGFNEIPNLVEPSLMPLESMQSWLNAQGPDLYYPGGHPNSKGCSLVAQHLISYIESCKIMRC